MRYNRLPWQSFAGAAVGGKKVKGSITSLLHLALADMTRSVVENAI